MTDQVTENQDQDEVIDEGTQAAPKLSYDDKDKPKNTLFKGDDKAGLEAWCKARTDEGFKVHVTDGVQNLAEGWDVQAVVKTDRRFEQLHEDIVVVAVPGAEVLTPAHIQAMVGYFGRTAANKIHTQFQKAGDWLNIELPTSVTEFMPGNNGSMVRRAMLVAHHIYTTRLKEEGRMELMVSNDELKMILSNAAYAKTRMPGMTQDTWEEFLEVMEVGFDEFLANYNEEKGHGKDDYVDLEATAEPFAAMIANRDTAVYEVPTASFSWGG